MRKLLNRLDKIKHIGLYIAMGAIVISALYSFVILPMFSDDLNPHPTADNYDKLALGIINDGSLSFYPNTESTVYRAPLYPLFIAICLNIFGNQIPQSVYAGQCIIFGLTILLVFAISSRLWNKKIAIITSILCSLHPYLIQYAGNILLENITIFLFTTSMFSVLLFFKKPSIKYGLLVGSVLGISALCKGTFIPFLFFTPLLLFIKVKTTRNKLYTVLVFLMAITIVTTWTIRNYNLTGKFIPVHTTAGQNSASGDFFSQRFLETPFSYSKLRKASIPDMENILNEWKSSSPGKWDSLKRWEKEVISDDLFRDYSYNSYKNNPLLLVRKGLVNAVMFWTTGTTEVNSFIISLLQIPLLLLVIYSVLKLRKRKHFQSIHFIHLLIVFHYFIFHLPVFAFSRLSVVLIPTMMIYAVAILKDYIDDYKV
ncbi:MAG: hypothetical protein GY855_15555 [candidate division Zixibacteria bacterium]|nr:hypothetical protein [candidate division Zixibacteria bacterium]